MESGSNPELSSANPLLPYKLGTLEYSGLQGKPITKSGVRILRPPEFEALRKAASRPCWYGCQGSEGQAILDLLLFTGMRYVEAQRFQAHPDWYSSPFIYLPEEAVEKHKRKQLERWIRLNTPGGQAVERFLLGKTKVPSWWTWTDALGRWATDAHIDPVGLGPKTTRKTWESWLAYFYLRDNPNAMNLILLSQGHTGGTSIAHYLNMPFTAEDRKGMEPLVSGWI